MSNTIVFIKESAARTDFHEFAGRAHLLTAQAGWEEVADYVGNWLGKLPIEMARTTSA